MRFLSRPGLVFQRAATVIKYYYYFYSNFTSDFFFLLAVTTHAFPQSNIIQLVYYYNQDILTYVTVVKDLAFSNIPSSNSGRTMRSPPQSYIYITITKQLCEINMVILQAHNEQNAYNYKYYMLVYITHGSSIFATHAHLQQLPLVLKYYLFTCNTKKHHT